MDEVKNNITDGHPSSMSSQPQNVTDLVEVITLQQWMTPGDNVVSANVRITQNQWISLNALIAYVAEKSQHYTFTLERKLSNRFRIPSLFCLPASHYDEAVRYLVDTLRP